MIFTNWFAGWRYVPIELCYTAVWRCRFLNTFWPHYTSSISTYLQPANQLVKSAIRGLLKYYVDFCCRVKTNRYPVMKFIWQPRPIFCPLTLKISCIQHEFVWSYASSKIPPSLSRARQWRRVRIGFHSVLSCLPKLVASGLRNCYWSCTLWLSVYSEHLTQTNYIYLQCRLHFKERHGPHPPN